MSIAVAQWIAIVAGGLSLGNICVQLRVGFLTMIASALAYTSLVFLLAQLAEGSCRAFIDALVAA